MVHDVYVRVLKMHEVNQYFKPEGFKGKYWRIICFTGWDCFIDEA